MYDYCIFVFKCKQNTLLKYVMIFINPLASRPTGLGKSPEIQIMFAHKQDWANLSLLAKLKGLVKLKKKSRKIGLARQGLYPPTLSIF